MKKRALVFAIVLLVLLAALGAAGQNSSADLRFLIKSEASGKPIRNASIVLHPVDNEGKQEKGGVQLKTNGEGKTEFPGAPYGKLRVQVIARGFQTFGEDYDINQPVHEIVIKLKRPQEQYSIYK
jgi:hypothetical protein